ncbi:AAA family ATPase [Streptomyces olivoreticuli]|uniref:AAA family ATPase n=1 Tax=Streptomyces olivoreticuli TaxID=68246 RepID=UPI000E2470C1|nr:AAA family ATPase [Streptomyces olivoreticuli]
MSQTTTPKLRTRKPTGIIPWPKILLEGEEKAGKSYVAAAFTGCEKTGQAYWLELGEDTADEYVNVPGANYVIIEHDGTYREILGQLEAVHAEAKRAAAAEEPPVVLVIDSVSLLWRMLVNWTQERGRRSKSGQNALRADPDAEVKPGMLLWNDAGERWNRVMYLVRTMPAIVLLLARGKEVNAVDGNGDPIPKTKTWRVEGHKHLAFDATVWVRMLRGDNRAHVIGARSLHFQLPREGKSLPMANFSIEHLVFDRLGCTPHTQPRQAPELAGDLTQPWLRKVEETAEKGGVEGLKKLWPKVGAAKNLSRDEINVIRSAIERAAAELQNPPKMGDPIVDPSSEAAKLRAAAAARQEQEQEQASESDPFDDDPNWMSGT